MPLNISGKEKSILVVDADSFFGNTICSSLGTFGYQADYASGSESGLARLDSRHYDLVIADTQSVGEVRARLQAAWRKTENYVPLIVSVQDQEDLPALGLDGSADEFIRKPLHMHEMFLRVTTLLRVRQLHERLREQKNIIQYWTQILDEVVTK